MKTRELQAAHDGWHETYC